MRSFYKPVMPDVVREIREEEHVLVAEMTDGEAAKYAAELSLAFLVHYEEQKEQSSKGAWKALALAGHRIRAVRVLRLKSDGSRDLRACVDQVDAYTAESA